jgi:hypothetical protein
VRNICNIQIKTLATYIWNRWNILNKILQHVSKTLATYATYATFPIYFCNVHIKQLQHSSETSETLEIYICNIEEEKPVPVNSGRRSGSLGRVAARDDLYIGFLRSLVKSPLSLSFFWYGWIRVPVCCVVVSAARRHTYGWIEDTRSYIHTVSEYMILQPACTHAHATITIRIAAAW